MTRELLTAIESAREAARVAELAIRTATQAASGQGAAWIVLHDLSTDACAISNQLNLLKQLAPEEMPQPEATLPPHTVADVDATGTDTLHEALARQGVFKGFNSLEGLADADDFWKNQPYGTRLEYGPGIADYLHRSVLRAAIRALKGESPR